MPDLVMKDFGFLFLPIHQGLYRGFMPQSPLGNVVVVYPYRSKVYSRFSEEPKRVVPNASLIRPLNRATIPPLHGRPKMCL